MQADVLVLGDEVESVLTAVSAARCGVRVVLARRSQSPLLGGLSTRGGLSYMDITPEYKGPLFQEFLARAQVIRVALDPHLAHQALQGLLDDAGVTVLSGIAPEPTLSPTGALLGVKGVSAPVVVDATPDADCARALGLPYVQGLGGLFGPERNFLGVSPVFRLSGVDRHDLMDFEARLRGHGQIRDFLAAALPERMPEEREALVHRPVYSPDDMDYVDVLNPTIGVFYHRWRHGDVGTYPDADIWIDGGNISRLPDGTLGFNGMVTRINDFATLLRLSQGAAIPSALLAEMQHFQHFLREEAGMRAATVIPPEALYVRQTLNMAAQQPMTARQAILDGVAEADAIGTFSYWLDLRGIALSRYFPGEALPKPVFNVGLGVALPADPRWPNLAFVSRSAGYSPLGQGAGRIIQHNALLGEAIGIAAALATQQGEALRQVPVAAVVDVLARRSTRERLELSGHATASKAACDTSPLLQRDAEIVKV